MTGTSALIWCGVSAPVVQGFFVGLGVASVGLVFFPYAFSLARPRSGQQSDYSRADRAVRWGRRLSWLLGVFTALTLAGYIVIYVSARGKFCNARLDAFAERLILYWTAATIVTAVLLIVSVTLRWRARSGG
jgi:hypothetical protein